VRRQSDPPCARRACFSRFPGRSRSRQRRAPTNRRKLMVATTSPAKFQFSFGHFPAIVREPPETGVFRNSTRSGLYLTVIQTQPPARMFAAPVSRWGRSGFPCRGAACTSTSAGRETSGNGRGSHLVSGGRPYRTFPMLEGAGPLNADAAPRKPSARTQKKPALAQPAGGGADVEWGVTVFLAPNHWSSPPMLQLSRGRLASISSAMNNQFQGRRASVLP